MNIYDFEVENIKGESVSLKEYENKIILIVNTATRCGFTPQYDELQDLYERYHSQEFVILDFPCNQFENQAPESNQEIYNFCDANFGIKFPMFAKIDVNGESASPLYKYLVSQKGFGGFDEAHPITPLLTSMLSRKNPDYQSSPEIKWNFTKFLIDKNGKVVERFEPTTDISHIEDKIKELL